MENDIKKFELIWEHPEYHSQLFEFKNPKSFLLEANFKVMKKQPTQKYYWVKFLFEEKHIPVCEEIKRFKKIFNQ